MKGIYKLLSGLILSCLLSGCSMFGLDLQEDYPYEKSILDPHINKTAREYLEERGKNPVVANDTVFKWMQLGLEYAELNLNEFEQSGRSFILLSNNAVRVRNATTGAITAGMWFDFPVIEKNPDGSIRFAADGVTPVSRPANKWSDYSKETVRNYFLYLIFQGEFGFSNALLENTSFQTLLPAGSVATRESRLGYAVATTSPNLNPSGARVFTYNYGAGGNGFDPEGKINMKILNSDYSPLQVNDQTNVSTAGIIALNGTVHVCSTTVYPWRY